MEKKGATYRFGKLKAEDNLWVTKECLLRKGRMAREGYDICYVSHTQIPHRRFSKFVFYFSLKKLSINAVAAHKTF